MVELSAPRTGKGVLIVVGIALVILLALYATMASTILVGAALIFGALYLLHACGVRVDRIIKGGR